MGKESLPINPMILKGNWTSGWALDYHTISSTYQKSSRFYKTKRTGLGEALYKLKYKKRWWWAKKIAKQAAAFLDERDIVHDIDLITAVPPARYRLFFQPVNMIAKRIGKLLEVPVKIGLLKRIKNIPPVKSLEDIPERLAAVKGLFKLTAGDLSGKNILILDDLYRSGATLREAVSVLKSGGNAGEVYVLTITKTRVNR